MGSNTVRIVAVPDRLVRDPATQRPVDEVGIDVDPADLNWSRIIADGDVAVVAVPAPAASKPTRTAQEA